MSKNTMKNDSIGNYPFYTALQNFKADVMVAQIDLYIYILVRFGSLDFKNVVAGKKRPTANHRTSAIRMMDTFLRTFGLDFFTKHS